MTQEEKAKAYDKALERAKVWKEKSGMPKDKQGILDDIFPELAESEDERIRKELIKFVKVNIADEERYIAWLEKQGEQEQDPCEHCKDKCLNCHNFPCIEKRAFEQGKSVFDVINEEKVDNANKVEPKFKVGDWITNGTTKPAQISSIEDDMYYTHNGTIGGDIESMDKDYHLWTIEDAKIGDILIYDNSIFIYNSIYENHLIYYGIYEHNKFHDDKYYSFIDLDTIDVNNIHPATKEQHDTLMKAIADAGYVFDFEKKELKLLITNGGDFDEKNCEQKHSIDINKMVDDYANNRERGNEEFGKPVPCMIRAYRQGLNDAIGKVVLKPAWSEEDENAVSVLRHIIKQSEKIDSNIYTKPVKEKLFDWLKSLKERLKGE